MAEPVIEYKFPTRIWIGPACHNCGYWATVPQKYRMALSCDADLLLQKKKEKPYQAKLQLKTMPDKTYQMDIINSKKLSKPYQAGMKIRQAKDFPYLGHVYILKPFDLEYSADVIICARNEALYQADIRPKFPFQAIYFGSLLVKKVTGSCYGMNIVIRQSYFDQMMRDLEINTPQYWDITAPLICRKRLMGDGETT